MGWDQQIFNDILSLSLLLKKNLKYCLQMFSEKLRDSFITNAFDDNLLKVSRKVGIGVKFTDFCYNYLISVKFNQNRLVKFNQNRLVNFWLHD